MADELLLLGGAGREHTHAGARMLGQKCEAIGHGVGNDALGAAALFDGLDLARFPLRRNGQANVEHLRELAGEFGRAAVLNEVLERAGNQQQVGVGQRRSDLRLGLVQAAAVLAHGRAYSTSRPSAAEPVRESMQRTSSSWVSATWHALA